MGAAPITSTNVDIGAGQGTPSFVSASTPVVSSSQPNSASVANEAVSPTAPSQGQITQAVSQINNAFTQGGQNVYASFEYNKAAGMEVIKFTNPNTQEVIGQVPPQAILGIAEAISQSLNKTGLLINTQA
jgi:uncharacterized FlaG/YvyC family protein